MSTDAGHGGATRLSPGAAFGVLGNDTRMEILQALGEADEPLTFTALRERVGTRDSGQFNYHLGKLDGHFVSKSPDGYVLRQAGRRVIEAVLSGAVTEAVVIEPTRVDDPCPYCSADIEISYREERLLVRCTRCEGTFADAQSTSGAFGRLPAGTLTLYYLPSAGTQGRTEDEILAATLAWTYSQYATVANGICPRCAGSITSSLDVCSDHRTDEAVCSHCDRRFAVFFQSRCGTCNQVWRGAIKHHLLADPAVRSFFERRGIDVLAPSWDDMTVFYTYDEEIRRTDPFEGVFTFTVDGDSLAVRIDEDLDVVDVTRADAT